MTEKMQYQRWLDFPLEDPALKEELLSIKDKDEEIFDRFYQELAFGTAGLRGVLGAGTNRMNIYTVRKATFNGKHYISLIDANVYSPAAYPTGWQEQA